MNAVLEAARDINSPIILQCSQGGSAFFGGKGLKNTEKQEASIAGSVAAAHYIRAIAPAYGMYVTPIACSAASVAYWIPGPDR